MASKPMQKWITFCNRIIEFGLIAIVIFSPLAYGSVSVRSYSLMELTVFFLALVWIVKMGLCKQLGFWSNKTSSSSRRNRSLRLFYFPIIFFFLLSIFQLIPLPAKVIKFLSPNTYKLYVLTVPGYGHEYPENRVPEDTKSTTANPIATSNQYRPLSITPYATKSILLQLFTYFTVFVLIVGNFTTRGCTRNRPKPGPTETAGSGPNDHHEYGATLINQIPINRLVHIIIGTGFVVAGLGILQKFSRTDKIYWLVDLPSTASPFGSFVNRNNFAGFVNMIIPIALSVFISKQSFLYKGSKNQFSLSRNMRKILLALEPWLINNWMCLLAIFTMISGLVLSTSRGGFVSFFCCLIIFFIMFTVSGKYDENSPRSIVVLAMIISILGLSFLWSNPYPLLKRISKLEDFGNYIEKASRVHAYRASMEMVKDFPWLGAGLGAFPNLYFKYRDRAMGNSKYVKAHSDYLQVLVETGVAGLVTIIVFTGLFFLAILSGYRHRKERNHMRVVFAGVVASISTMLFHSAISFNIQIPANAFLFAVVLGYASVLSRDRERL